MKLKQYQIRLEDWQMPELEQRAGINPVAPLIRKIITDWLGLDNTQQREQIVEQIEGLTGKINILNQQLKDVDDNKYKLKIRDETDQDRQEYLNNHPDVLEMHHNKSIGPKGYQLLKATLGFKNNDEVNHWLDKQC